MNDLSKNETEVHRDTNSEETRARVRARLGEGGAITDVVRELIADGVDTRRAWDLAGEEKERLRPRRRRARPLAGSVLRALAAGLCAAGVGAVVWYVVAVELWYEVALVAAGIGALCGLAVALSSARRKRPAHRAVAVACALAGILAGKYAVFVHLLADTVAEKHGSFAASLVSPFSAETFSTFLDTAEKTFHLWDAGFALLAWALAWTLAARPLHPARRG